MCNTKPILVILDAGMESVIGGLANGIHELKKDTIMFFLFIMALRFLTDYFNNDFYYKVNYREHNLDRARNQFKLIKSLSEKIENQK